MKSNSRRIEVGPCWEFHGEVSTVVVFVVGGFVTHVFGPKMTKF